MTKPDSWPIQAQWAEYFRLSGLKTFPVYGVDEAKQCLCGKKNCGSSGKHPMVSNWNTGNHFKSEQEISRHWEVHPRSNYGIVTDDLLVVDVDGADGEGSYAAYIFSLVNNIPTLRVKSGKGWHEYYLDPRGEFRNAVGIFPGIDLRGMGGYIVAPYSNHNSGKVYEIFDYGTQDRKAINIAEIPTELRNFLLSHLRSSVGASKETVKALIALGAKIPQGMRNTGLASYLGTLIHKGYSEEEIKVLALDFNETKMESPLEEQEVFKTVNSLMNHHPGNITPLPLFRELAPSARYPIEALGEILQPSAIALQEAIQAPEALIGQSLLAAASLVVQGHANVQIDERSYPTTLYLLTIGASGERKSSVDREALSAHREYEHQRQSEYKEQLRRYLSNKQIYEAQHKNIVNSQKLSRSEKEQQILQLGPEPAPPFSQDILIEEPTYEGLVKVLQVGRPSIGLFSDEGGRMIGGHGMSSDNLLKTIAGLSSLWDGTPISRVRAGDGTIKLYGKRLALHLMVQPGVADLLLGNSMVVDQGLLARCLISFPESTVGTRPYRQVNLKSHPAMQKYLGVIGTILNRPLPLASDTNELRVRQIFPDPDAYIAWVEFHDEVESQMAEDAKYCTIRGFAAKAAEQAIRISGVLTLLNDIDAKTISKRQMENAIELVTYYLSEFVRLNGGATLNPDLALAKRLLEWSQKFDEVFLSQIYQFGPNGLRDQATAKRIVDILEKHFWLKKIPGGKKIKGKHRAEAWEVIRESP